MDALTIYTKAFNQGYALQKEKPELASALIKGFVDKSHVYAEGFVDGVKEYQKEKEQKLENYMAEQRTTQHINKSKQERYRKDLENLDRSNEIDRS